MEDRVLKKNQIRGDSHFLLVFREHTDRLELRNILIRIFLVLREMIYPYKGGFLILLLSYVTPLVPPRAAHPLRR